MRSSFRLLLLSLSSLAVVLCTTALSAQSIRSKRKPATSSSTTTSSGTSASSTPVSAPATLTTLTRTWNACGGPSATSLMCAAVQVAVTGTSTVIRVRNLSGDPALDHGGAVTSGQWVLTTVGFEGIAAAAGTFTTGIGASTGSWLQQAGGTAPSSWQRFDDKQYGGVNLDFGIDNGTGISNGIASSCAPAGSLPGGSNRFWISPVATCVGYTIAGRLPSDGWFETQLTTAETWNPNGDDVSVYFKGQNGPGGGSYECLFGGGRNVGNCSDGQFVDASGTVAPLAAVPEPRTLLLVGTGAAALLIVRHRKRRL